MSFDRTITRAQRELLEADLGYDDGGRYAVVAVAGYAITGDAGNDPFGVVFALIDSDSGDEVAVSPVVGAMDAREERRHWIGRTRHLNGKEEVFV